MRNLLNVFEDIVDLVSVGKEVVGLGVVVYGENRRVVGLLSVYWDVKMVEYDRKV